MTKGLFLGLSGIDLIYYSDNYLQKNSKIKTEEFTLDIGGPATNAAVTYSLLGGEAILVTAIGSSMFGRFAKEMLFEKYGIEVIDIVKSSDKLPGISSILINTDGDRSIISGQRGSEIYDEIDINLDDVNFCLFDCNIHEVSLGILKSLRERNIDTILDAGNWKPQMAEYFPYATEIIASSACSPPNKSIGDYLKDIGCTRYAITNGERVVELFENDAVDEISPPRSNAIDTLGAGDILHGAYCYYRFNKGFDFKQSLVNAVKIASKSTEFRGTREGILNMLSL